MRVVVDHDVCEANGVCEGIAPDVFRLGEDDVLEIVQPDVPAGLEDAVREAELRCPKAALAVHED